ncbi:MAG: Trp family transcriptional regulator [bacterium]
MSQVSRHKLNQKVYDKIFSLFPQFLGRLSSQGHAQVVVNALFSTTERTIIAKRIATAFMLVKGYTYSEISSKLCISYGTIGKIAEVTKNADTRFVKELQLISQEQAFGEFLNAIGYRVAKLLPPKGGNWSVWRRNIEEERRQAEQSF